MFKVKQILAALSLCMLAVLGYTTSVQAAQSSSTKYSVDEVNFGAGGELHACSDQYCAKEAAGELTVGNTKGSAYQAQAGFNTNREEFLEVSIPGGIIDLGTVSATAVKYGSTTFSVKTYLASGYTVTISGTPPTNASGGHQISAMSSIDTSHTGTEQFGINLVHNIAPSVGADPAELPDGTFSFGAAVAGYNTANNFKFVSGDTIAGAPSSSGTTNYTLSAIENVATSTPAGAYKTNLVIGVVPTF